LTGFTNGGWPTTFGAFNTNFNGASDAFVTKLIAIGTPATLTLAPATDTNPVGTPHTVTATVTDFAVQPVAGVSVRFSVTNATVTAAMPSSGSAVTDTSGQAQFSFTASLVGENNIHAFADTNANRTQDTGEASSDATKTWIPPASTAGCRVNLGGSIIAGNGDRATFDGSVRVTGSEVRGPITYQDHGPATPMRVQAVALAAMTCTADSSAATIFGGATIDGSGM
jgi:hypothetical protein